MDNILIKDKKFSLYLTEEEILKEVKRVADEINRDLQGECPLFLSILNGSFMFTADLLKYISLPCEVSFVKLASYEGTSSTGSVKELIGLNTDIEGRTVVIVEDIIESGLTMASLLEQLRARNPKDIRIASLLVKPDLLQVDLHIDYEVKDIPNDFVVGYGLDYDGQGRNYRHLYQLADRT